MRFLAFVTVGASGLFAHSKNIYLRFRRIFGSTQNWVKKENTIKGTNNNIR